MIICKGCGEILAISLHEGQVYFCKVNEKNYMRYEYRIDEEYLPKKQSQYVVRYWVKQEHLIHEEASIDLSTNPNYVEVIKTEDIK